MICGMAALMPSAVQVEQATTDAPTQSLFPQEAALVAGAVPKRVNEFVTVRACARRALARLSLPPSPILPGPNREPLWPVGVVGSLTHCNGYRAAAVAFKQDIATIGIDAEPNVPLPDGVAELVTVGAEIASLRRLAAVDPRIAWDKLLFSAKESIYKAWFPVTHSWLNFTDCELEIQPSDGIFTGELLVPGPALGTRHIKEFNGRWSVHGQHILTAVWEPGP